MPKYRITDPQTGRTVTVSGEKPPTQQDAEVIFTQAGLRQTTSPQPSLGKQAVGAVESFGNTFFPAVTNFARQAGSTIAMRGGDQQAYETSLSQAQSMNQRLTEAIKRETDPAKRALLIKTARDSGMNIADIAADQSQSQQQTMGLTDTQANRGNVENALRGGAAVGTELASWLLPGSNGTQAATRVGRIAQAGARGAQAGALTGTTNALLNADSVGEAAGSVGIGAAGGAVMGGVAQTAMEGLSLGIQALKSVGGKIPAQAKEDVLAKLKPTKSIRAEARERGIDIADETIKKYGDNLEENIAKASTDSRTMSENISGYLDSKPRSRVNVKTLVDDIAESMKKEARTQSQKNAIDDWADFIKNDKFGNDNRKATLRKVFEEKTAAGQSGYKNNSDVVASFVGQADAKLERSLRKAVLDSLPKAEREIVEGMMREQEANIFMQNVFENTLSSVAPKSTAQKVASNASIPGIIKQTVGSVAEKGVSMANQPPDLIKMIASVASGSIDRTGKVAQAGLRNPQTFVNPTISAIQRMLDKERQQKQSAKKLP